MAEVPQISGMGDGVNRLHNADVSSNFGLLSEACDKARKTGRVIWATVSHCPGKLFKVFPGGRTIKYSLGGIIEDYERDPLTEDAINDPEGD